MTSGLLICHQHSFEFIYNICIYIYIIPGTILWWFQTGSPLSPYMGKMSKLTRVIHVIWHCWVFQPPSIESTYGSYFLKHRPPHHCKQAFIETFGKWRESPNHQLNCRISNGAFRIFEHLKSQLTINFRWRYLPTTWEISSSFRFSTVTPNLWPVNHPGKSLPGAISVNLWEASTGVGPSLIPNFTQAEFQSTVGRVASDGEGPSPVEVDVVPAVWDDQLMQTKHPWFVWFVDWYPLIFRNNLKFCKWTFPRSVFKVTSSLVEYDQSHQDANKKSICDNQCDA